MTYTKQTREKMSLALEHLKDELKGIRTGRANTSMLDNIFVEIYGSSMRIKDIASITAPEARQLLITPFDRQNTAAIGKAIEKANLGFTLIVDANCIRIKIASMDESTRKEMVKLCQKRCEEAKVSIRNIRREINDAVKKEKLPEDVTKKEEKEVQELTDKFCKEAEDITSKKEKEIITI